MSAHIFAVHIPVVPLTTTFTVLDEPVVHRITTVLRLTPSQKIILFDQHNVLVGILLRATKKSIEIQAEQRSTITTLTPHITWLLPLLEKEYFEETLYYMTVLGVTTIVPVITHSSGRFIPTKIDRMQRIMVAAAEQSKQFSLPHIAEPIRLEAALLKYSAPIKLFFDVDGAPARDLLSADHQAIIGVTGPEAGLTDTEKALLIKHGYHCCKLTPTILKASHAAFLAAGILRVL